MTQIFDGLAVGLFWLAVLSLLHVYFAYEWLLRAAVRLTKATREIAPANQSEEFPRLSVLLTVHNEEAEITARLEDILGQDYPSDRLEIVVASDGSTDHTEALVQSFAAAHPDRAIVLVAARSQGGKSAAQNLALTSVTGEIVVLTDAATRFASDFLRLIAQPFRDANVGCVSGQVKFARNDGSISSGQERYWQSEMMLRDCESRLGILAVASGQAMAFRRALFRPLPPHIGDDCIIPLDVAAAGARVVHQPNAIAFDTNESRIRRELRARARMTARNWVGTWRHPVLLSPLHHPGYSLALWSHKLMRWLSPVFLLVMAMTSAWLSRQPFYGLCFASGVALSVVAAIGYGAERTGGKTGLFWRIAGMALAFFVAQLGFLLGLWTVIRGRKIFAYRNTD